jgi:hypothetical protein
MVMTPGPYSLGHQLYFIDGDQNARISLRSMQVQLLVLSAFGLQVLMLDEVDQ